MEKFYKAFSYSKREKEPYPVFVTDEVYDLVTDGDVKSPLFWKGDGTVAGKAVPIIPEKRKSEGIKMINGGDTIGLVTVQK